MTFVRGSESVGYICLPSLCIKIRKLKNVAYFLGVSVIFITFGCLQNLIGPLYRLDDQAVLRRLRDYILIPPDIRPYNLSPPSDLSYEGNYSSDYLEPILTQLFNYKKNGVFVEAGAYDGEIGSNTLYLERFFNWSGLLVEPVPRNVQHIKGLHRKAWLAPVCLSLTSAVVKSKIYEAGQISHLKEAELLENRTVLKCETETPDDWYHMYVPKDAAVEMKSSGFMDYHKCDTDLPSYELECFPLHSVLSAVGYTDIDFFSLDVEGSELQVLKTIPFHKIHFQVIMVETDKSNDFNELIRFLFKNGYKRKTTMGTYDLTTYLPRDMLFVKREIN